MIARGYPFAAALLLAGCITVNIYFPAPEVRRAAEQIVEETWGREGPGAATPAARATESSWLRLLEVPAVARAQEVDINVSTAAIRALKEQMRLRAAQLRPYLDGGQLGISRDGMLVVRNLDGMSLKDQATVRRLVEAENRDRETLYQEIAKANDFGAERVGDIRRIFAETWLEKAERGWWLQSGDTWAQKR